jgi:hypothetical protein
VSLGLGSVIATVFETAPWLAVVSRHKGSVFLAVGALLAFNYWIAIVRPGRQPCAPGELCHVDSVASRLNRWLFWLSAAMYATAVATAYAAAWFVRMLS